MNRGTSGSPTLFLYYFLALLFMTVTAFTPTNPQQHNKSKRNNKSSKQQQKKKQHHPSSWDQIKSLLTCKQVEIESPSTKPIVNGYSRLGSSCSSICSFRDVVHSNTRVVDRADNSPESSTVGIQQTGILTRKPLNNNKPSSSSTTITTTTVVRSTNGGCSVSSSNSKAMQFRKLSGCYECRTIVDPSRYPSPRTTIRVCSQCGEVFPKIESLELHQSIKHAVSELGTEDSGRNIVEIIFKSSWMKAESPICKIERILKVHNTQRTIQRFEECRDAVKARANANVKKNPRCAADGNELLRFHCTSLTCALGARGSSTLCGAIPGCGVCTVIRHGFSSKGVRTTASSGRAHDGFLGGSGSVGRRAMLVCRVIAGRVKRISDDATAEEDSVAAAISVYDSVAGQSVVYANLEELVVFNPRAILPCFVVIYKAID